MKKFGIFLILFCTTLGAFALTEEERILKQTVLYENRGGYLNNSLYQGVYVLRWNRAYFPLKIYIKRTSAVPNYYFDSFKRAVGIWQNELRGIIRFKLVDNENDADIVFQIIERKKETEVPVMGEQDTLMLAYTQSIVKSNKLKKMLICVYERDDKGKFYNPKLVLNTSVHEFAHALGVLGHSNEPKSIMYAVSDESIEKKVIYISSNDKNTIKLLYMIAPDITNGSKEKEKGNLKAEIFLGTLNDRLENSIGKLKVEMALYHDFPTAMQVVFLYRDKKDYENMKKYLEIAKRYAKTRDDHKSLYMGYAAYYSDLHNFLASLWCILKSIFAR